MIFAMALYVTIKHKGNFFKQYKLQKRSTRKHMVAILEKYGQQGVDALKAATPRDTGKTAESWYFEVAETDHGARLDFKNSNEVNGWFNVAIMLQYGHGTKNGGWVEGRDYINPALQPIFDDMVQRAWKEVMESNG